MTDTTTISAADLETVTGGATPSSGSSTNDQLITMLQGLQSSLKDLSCNNNNNGLFGGNNGLLFMTMALMMQRRSDVYVYGGGRYCWRTW